MEYSPFTNKTFIFEKSKQFNSKYNVQNAMCKIQRYGFQMKHTANIQLTIDFLKHNPKIKDIFKIQNKIEFKNVVEENSETVYVHNLYSLKLSKTSHSVTSKFVNAE